MTGLPASGRIFAIGLSRTGTMSLARALGLLGFRSLHFPHDDPTREEILTFLAGGGERLRLSALERLDAVADTPVCVTYKALDAAYPGSKFILTTREKESWLESCRAYWAARIDQYLAQSPDDPFAVYISAIHTKLYGSATFDHECFSRAYDSYHEEVGRHFRERPRDMLSIEIASGAGWGPLCEFLGLPRPRAEFPWANRLSG
jgi:hypothetical protein